MLSIVQQTLFSCILTITKIFYSLNCIDLPEYFEDHIEDWMGQFLNLLSLEVPGPLKELLEGDVSNLGYVRENI